MKSIRYALTFAALFTTTFTLAQSTSQRSFATLKTLGGAWEGKNSQGQTLKVVFRETAGGSALLSEIQGHGHENMVSMIHMDGDRVLMTHYCGAGNQPRMKATLSPDGKSVSFDFVDATNLAAPDAGHMNHVVFSMPDGDHHTEEWTYVDHGKEMKEVFTLQRAN
jgi:hypothetical protein